MVDRTNWNYPATRDGLLSRFIDKAKDPNYRQQTLYPLAEDVAQDFTPVVGEAKSASEADQAFKNMGRTFRGGDYFSSAGYLGEGLTGLLGAVPVLGLGVRGAKRLTDPIAEQAPVFYSKLSNFFKDAPQKKAQGKQWQGMLDPQKSGVKSEEVEYTGIKSLLDENPDKVFSKEELKDVADSNRIQVEENVYGDSSVITKQEYEDQPEIHSVYRADDPDGRYAGIVGLIIKKPINEVYPHLENRSTGVGFIGAELTHTYVVNVPDLPKQNFPTLDKAKEFIQKNTDLGSTTRHSSYQLEGGENYKELVLKLPKNLPPTQRGYSIQKMEDGEYTLVGPDGAGQRLHTKDRLEAEREATGYLLRVDANPLFRYPSHFDDDNPLLHVRFNDRTDADGGKQLFIEELQSDWAQQGREKGFKDTKKYDSDFKALNKKMDDLKEEYRSIGNRWLKSRGMSDDDMNELAVRSIFDGELTKYATNRTFSMPESEVPPTFWEGPKSDDIREVLGDESFQRLSDIRKEFQQTFAEQNRLGSIQMSGIEPAPFVTSTDKWTDLGLRRMLRWAVDNGYDSIGWTTGVQQVNRYQTELRQQVKSFKFIPSEDYGFPTGGLVVDTPQGRRTFGSMEEMRSFLGDDHILVDDKTDDFVLEVNTPAGSQTHIAFEKNKEGRFVSVNPIDGDKQPLEKIVGKDVAKGFYDGETYFEGDDLTIGGEGMKESYDRIIPKRMKEIARKMGEKNVKIEKVSAKTGDKVEESRLRYEVHDEDGAIDAFPTREMAESYLDDLSEAYGGNTFVVDSYAEDLKKSDAKRENVWSMKITDKMREAIKKGLPLMAGAGITTGLLSQYQNQKNQNQSLLY